MNDWERRTKDRAYTIDIYFDYNPQLGDGLLDVLEQNLIKALEGMCKIDVDATDITITDGRNWETVTFYAKMDIDMTCQQAYKQSRDLIKAVIPKELMENLGDWDVVPDPVNPEDY